MVTIVVVCGTFAIKLNRDQKQSKEIRKKQRSLLDDAKESGSLGEVAFIPPHLTHTLPPNFYELQTHLYCQFHGIEVSFATPSLFRSS
jgi:hypothetical protein